MKKLSYILMSLCLILLYGCSLDYKNTGAISPDNVWTDKKMINAFLTNIYGEMLPGWPYGTANDSDEGMNGGSSLGTYLRGQITIDNCGQGFNYTHIDRINFFLEHLEDNTILAEQEKKEFAGQALFWRAWDYWGKVWTLGGVPLILSSQDVTDASSLFVARNSTTECVEQILKDLDTAIAALPDTWDDENYGRIDKGCAMAFKGRVLLQYASPLFNPDGDQNRWKAAYNANKEAVDFLKSVGKGLYSGKFEDIWYQEQNEEVVMVNQYYYPDHTNNQNIIRPLHLTKDEANNNQAQLPLLLAFPRIDGSKLSLDINKLATDPAYNAQFVDDFYANRDSRFYATIFTPGTIYPMPDFPTGNNEHRYWNAWKKVPGESGYEMLSLLNEEMGKAENLTNSGFHQLKGLDKTVTIALLQNSTVDWIEIRFAEVLMNYGECANETGKSSEALQVLYDIRKRAGIQAGKGNYGIQATSQADIRQAYMDERFIEFTFEGKRFSDLRRWKRFDILNELKYRSGLALVLKDNADLVNFDWKNDMSDPEVRKMFQFDYIECLDGDKQYSYNVDLNHWFYPIKKNDMDRNSKLVQNNEWGGSFDPLK